MFAVSELALISVFAMSRLFEWAAHFSLVAARVDVGVLGWSVDGLATIRHRLRQRSIQLSLTGSVLLQDVVQVVVSHLGLLVGLVDSQELTGAQLGRGAHGAGDAHGRGRATACRTMP